MSASSTKLLRASTRRHAAIVDAGCIGLCISCGHRLTLCGKPFTAEILCRNCNKTNVYLESRKPVRLADMESSVIS